MTMTPATAADLVARAYAADHSGVEIDVAAVMRGGEVRRRHRRNASTAAVAAGGSLAFVLATVIGTNALEPPTTVAPVASEVDATDLLAVLARPQADADQMLPEYTDDDVLDDRSILPSSTRLITAVDGVDYYAGTSKEHDVCIGVDSPETGGSSCVPLAEFEATGVWVTSSGDTYPPSRGADFVHTTLLLPDNLSITDGTDPAELVERAKIPSEFVVGNIEVFGPNLIVMRQDP
jgi:hypothetical protein